MNALKLSLADPTLTGDIFISQRDFAFALQKVFPSVSKKDE